MTKFLTKGFISSFFVLSVALTGFAQKPVAATGTNVLKKELQMKLDEWHKAGKFPGATLGVVLADGESFGLAVGYSDRDAKTPMKPNDRMLAGSVGKTFAAATAMQLVKEGKIGLDDKIEKYLGKEAVVRPSAERKRHHRPPVDESHERSRAIRIQGGVHRIT